MPFITVTSSRYCILCAVLSCIPSGLAAVEPNIERIRRDWEERFTRTRNVVYQTEGQQISPKGTIIYAGDSTAPASIRETGYPPEDMSKAYELNWYVDHQHGFLRLERTNYVFDVDAVEFEEQRIVDAFDGETLWTGSLDGEGGLSLQPSSRAKWFFTTASLPMFFAHGMFPLELLNYKDLSSQTADDLTLTPAGFSVVEGRRCEVVRVQWRGSDPDVRQLLHVDPERHSAVLRYEEKFVGKPSALSFVPEREYPEGPVLGMSIDIEQQEVDGMWVPLRWVKNVYDTLNARVVDGRAKTDLTETIKLEVVEVEINAGIDPSLFTQPREAGMIVQDRRGDYEKYVVADDGETLVPLPRGGTAETTASLPYWLAVTGIGILLFCAGVVLFRRALRR